MGQLPEECFRSFEHVGIVQQNGEDDIEGCKGASHASLTDGGAICRAIAAFSTALKFMRSPVTALVAGCQRTAAGSEAAG